MWHLIESLNLLGVNQILKTPQPNSEQFFISFMGKARYIPKVRFSDSVEGSLTFLHTEMNLL